MVYYRKYRPQTLPEVIGQQNVTETLIKAFESGNLAHAYLFTGPRGTGKTSTARILAKMVNCGQKDAPCNKCDSCISITDGSALDYIEIDAASNRGIDDIRTLRENIKLAPSNSKKKIYILDEIHMLTAEAFNALLKTLEEPPEHVLFILATTEVHKVPATIISRVQRLDFQLARTEDLLTALQNVASKEKLEIEPEALNLIAKRAEGSFRDAVKHLDQLASAGGKITLEMVEESFKSGSFTDALDLLEAIAQKDPKLALELVNKQVEQGTHLKEFTHQVLEILRSLMLSKHGAKVGEEFGSEKLVQLKALGEKLDQAQILRVINSLHEGLERMKTTSLPLLALEVAVVESCLPSTAEQTTVIATPDLGPEGKQSQGLNSEIATSARPPRNDLTISEKTKEKLEEAKIEPGIPTASNSDDAEDLNKLLDKWNYILETVKPYNYSLEALLRQVKVTSCDNGLVILEVPYSFHQRILEAPKSRDLLESVISDVLGKSGRVSCVLGARPVRIEEVANVELAADDDVLRIAAEIFNS